MPNTKPPVFERSVATISDMEFRDADSGSHFSGYAAVFDAPSEPMPYIETIAPGAFARSLRGGGQTFVVDHDDTRLLSSVRAKTLRLSEDSRGLLVDADLPDTSYARDLRELHAKGEIRSMSFTFRATRGGEAMSDDGKRRTLSDVKLGHVTVLTGLTPAYRQTTASIRALAHKLDSEAEELSDALEALRNGDPLDERAVSLLTALVGELREQPAETVPDSTEERDVPPSVVAALADIDARMATLQAR